METKDKKLMNGDYQVIKSSEDVFSSDRIFGSTSSSPTATILNPNLKFAAFDNPNFPYMIPKEEEYRVMSMIGSGSGVSTGSGHYLVETSAIEQESPSAKRRRYHGHTIHQIQEMEAYVFMPSFEENSRPDDLTRMRLSYELGLTPLQVKFWFQNKRTQVKAQQNRRANVMLKAENDTLKIESQDLQCSSQCLSCSTCGNNLRLENTRLRQELDWLRRVVSMRNPHPPSQENACFFPETDNNKNVNNNVLIAEEEKAVAMELAVSCCKELTIMCGTNEPLWTKKRLDSESVCLIEQEYKKMFIWPPMDDDDRFRREASRAKAVVMMNSITLVKAFLDADKWSELFFPIVSSAKLIQIISSKVSGANGSLLLMYAGLQVVCPLIPTREAYFLRYVERKAKKGKWMIVDFPIDSFGGFVKPASTATATELYRRKPSGCMIQEMANGYSEVTWVEHVEVEEKQEQDEVVREYVKSGVAFGAERWLAVLKRQCEGMASLMATNITDLGVIPSVKARKNLMTLSHRMVKTFCLNICNSYGQTSTKDTVRIVTRRVCGSLVPCAVSVTYLPYSHHKVFDLLRDNQRLSQILFNGSLFQEVAHIANGSHPINCTSLLRINMETNASHNVEFMLQETCTDNSGSLLVYSTVDADAVQLAMNGEDPSEIPLLPVGFSVVPVNPSNGVAGTSVNLPSCLLTVAIQVLGSNTSAAAAKLDRSTVSAINSRICATVNRIASALVNDVGN